LTKAFPPEAWLPAPPAATDAGLTAAPEDESPVAGATPAAPAAEVSARLEVASRVVTIQGSPVPWSAAGQPGTQPRGPVAVAGTITVGQGARTGENDRLAAPVTPAPTGALPVGATPFRIGPYEVATRIARGAMASVYVCRQANGEDPSRLLALKVIRQHTSQKDVAAASFRNEARVGAAFRHPNAQTVIEEGLFEDQPYLVLDYVEGGALSELLGRETRPAPAVTVSVVLDILAALAALHRTADASGAPLGLVHADISPENVLVGVDGAARLADFGSTRFTAVDDQAHPFAISKPPWMPPEQFAGEPLDASSDLYSVGVLLWTALAGHQPFAAEAYDQIVMNVMRRKVSPPSAFGAPRGLDDVCAQAMSRFREQRFLMADAMATALRSAAASAGLIASKAEVAQWVQRSLADELAQRRRIVAAMFGGGSPTARPITPSGRSPVTPAASSALSAKTLFLPGIEPPEEPPRKNWAAAFWIGVGLAIALSLGLTVSAWIKHRRWLALGRDTPAAPVAAPSVASPNSNPPPH
jgi:serine/threonine protein kinase